MYSYVWTTTLELHPLIATKMFWIGFNARIFTATVPSVALGFCQPNANPERTFSGYRNIYTETAHVDSLNQIEKLEGKRGQQVGQARGAQGGFMKDRPNFHSELRSVETFERRPVHFEAKVTPVNDPSLKIEWLFNGQPLRQGDRVWKWKIRVRNASIHISLWSDPFNARNLFT